MCDHPTLKTVCAAIHGIAAAVLLITALGWFYLDRVYSRPEASLPTPSHGYLLYLHNEPVYTTPVLGAFYKSAPVICALLIILTFSLNQVTKRVDWEKLVRW